MNAVLRLTSLHVVSASAYMRPSYFTHVDYLFYYAYATEGGSLSEAGVHPSLSLSVCLSVCMSVQKVCVIESRLLLKVYKVVVAATTPSAG